MPCKFGMLTKHNLPPIVWVGYFVNQISDLSLYENPITGSLIVFHVFSERQRIGWQKFAR